MILIYLLLTINILRYFGHLPDMKEFTENDPNITLPITNIIASQRNIDLK